MDATSNAGEDAGDCAEPSRAFNSAKTIGPATAAAMIPRIRCDKSLVIAISSPLRSISRGLVHVVNDKRIHGSFLRFEFQPELLLQRGEESWAGRVGGRRGPSIGAWPHAFEHLV